LITELQKVLTESVESRKSEKRMLDLALPMQIRANAAADTINSGDHMSFAVMTKRNTRGPLKTINIPLSSQFAALNLSNQEAKEAEKRELKRVVLRLESERI
jgi:hypothetical protein